MAPHFDLILLPEVTLLPYAGFTDKLRFSADDEDHSRQRFCTWQTLRLSEDVVAASSGAAFDVPQLAPEHDFSRTDYLVLFGGRTAASALEQAKWLKPLLPAIRRHGVHLVAIDNAVFTLAVCGLLNNKPVTLHWRHQTQLKAQFPSVKLQQSGLYCTHGNITTAVGGTGAIELAEYLLAQKLSPVQAAKGLADMMVSQKRNPLAFTAWGNTPAVTDRHLYRALILMSESLGNSLDMAQLSEQIGLSRRQLDRKFNAQFDCSAAVYFQRMRLEKAAWLLRNSTDSLSQVALSVGFSHAGHFRSVFKEKYHCTPTSYRQNQ